MRFLITLAMLLPMFAHAIGGPLGNAVALQGRPIATTAPSDTNVLAYNATTKKWEPQAASAGSGDITAVTAGNGVYGGAASGAATVSADEPAGIVNCSITASVAANALTIALKDASGADPSASSPCIVSFRNATATTGTYSVVSATAATSVVVNDTATLGMTASVTAPIYVYAINNAGTLELAVASWKLADEGAVISSTTVGTGADTLGTLYSTTGRSNVAHRLLGEVQIAIGASEHWSNSPTKISNLPFQHYWFKETAVTPVMTPSSGSMTNTTLTGTVQRIGNSVRVRGKAAISGSTGTWSRFQVDPPTGCTIDTTTAFQQDVTGMGGGILFAAGAADYPVSILFTGSGRYAVETWKYIGNGSGAATAYPQIADLSNSVPATWQNGDGISWYTMFPCTGW